MSNVLRLHRDTVKEVLEEIEAEAPECVVAFTLKNGQFLIHASNIPSVTMLIGAMERAKFDLLENK